MAEEKTPFRGVKRFFLGYFLLLILTLTFIGVMGRLSYAPVDTSMVFALFGLLVCSALIALAVFLVRKVRARGLRILAGAFSALLVLAVAMAMFSFFSLILVTSTPQHYTTLTAPSGHAVVVLRQLSADAERIEARCAARGEVWNPEAPSAEDFGYRYQAHPRVARFFYDERIQAEGALEIGCASDAQLMFEWLDGDVLRLYVENARSGDGGELTLATGAPE